MESSKTIRRLLTQQRVLLVRFSLATLVLVGCSDASAPAERPVCSDEQSLETIACRIAQDSFDGRFPRRISHNEAQSLAEAFGELGELNRALERGTIRPEEAGERAVALHAKCRDMVAMSCAELFLSPRSND